MLRISQIIGMTAALAVASIVFMSSAEQTCDRSPGSVAAMFAPALLCD